MWEQAKKWCRNKSNKSKDENKVIVMRKMIQFLCVDSDCRTSGLTYVW